MVSLSSPFMSMAVDSFMAISVKDSGLLSENIKLFSRIIVNDGNQSLSAFCDTLRFYVVVRDFAGNRKGCLRSQEILSGGSYFLSLFEKLVYGGWESWVY